MGGSTPSTQQRLLSSTPPVPSEGSSAQMRTSIRRGRSRRSILTENRFTISTFYSSKTQANEPERDKASLIK